MVCRSQRGKKSGRRLSSQIPSIEPEGFLTGLSPGAILFGAVIDIVASLASFFLLAGMLGPEAPPNGGAPTEPAGADFYASPEFLIGSLVLGLAATVLGAFVGARLAGTLFVRHGGWVAVASTVLMLPFLLVPTDAATPAPTWYDVVGWVLILPAGMAGGALAALVAASATTD